MSCSWSQAIYRNSRWRFVSTRNWCYDCRVLVRRRICLLISAEVRDVVSTRRVPSPTPWLNYSSNNLRKYTRWRLLGTKPEDVESAFCMLVTECRCSPESALAAVETLVGVNSCMPNRFKKACLERCVRLWRVLLTTCEPSHVRVGARSIRSNFVRHGSNNVLSTAFVRRMSLHGLSGENEINVIDFVVFKSEQRPKRVTSISSTRTPKSYIRITQSRERSWVQVSKEILSYIVCKYDNYWYFYNNKKKLRQQKKIYIPYKILIW